MKQWFVELWGEDEDEIAEYHIGWGTVSVHASHMMEAFTSPDLFDVIKRFSEEAGICDSVVLESITSALTELHEKHPDNGIRLAYSVE